MASITALLNQQQGTPQGNVNPLLYRLAANPANGVFHDATVASSGVANCTLAIPSMCNNSTAGPTALTGGQPGFLLTSGYDLATGLGSLDVGKLLATAATAAGLPTVTALSGSSGTIPAGQALTFAVAISPVATAGSIPSGSVQFFANGTVFGGPVTLVAGKGSVTMPDSLPVGPNLITATYSGDGMFAASNSSALAISVQVGSTPSATVLTASPNPVYTNQTTTLTVQVAPASGTGITPGGTVNLLFNGSLLSSSGLYQGVATFTFSFLAQTYPLIASYSGDGTYAASTSPVVNLVSTAGPTTTVLSGATSVVTGTILNVTATINNLAFTTLSSFVTFYDGNTMLGSVAVTKTTNAAKLTVSYTGAAGLMTGNHSITAVFQGDANNQGSTSAPLVIAVGIPPGITVAAAPPSLTLAAGATTGNTDVLTVASVGAFAGNVSFACTVTYNGTGTSTYLPTCSTSAASVALASQGTATTTLTIGTTVPHAQPSGGRAENVAPGGGWTPGGIVLALLGWIPLGLAAERRSWRWSRRRLAGLLTTVLFAAGLVALAGCSKSTATPTTPPAPAHPVGTTPGSYSITVVSSGTGTGTVSASTTIGLTVQ